MPFTNRSDKYSSHRATAMQVVASPEQDYDARAQPLLPFLSVPFNFRAKTDRPTHTDVLLGRGVAANRHPGNENFRAIVAKQVDVYVTSTKKQKMMISRAVVDHVRTQLNPPGRFLEKDAETGLWTEVDDKRALEKTAQALRDGALPLRKQLLGTSKGPSLLDGGLFDGSGNTSNSSASSASTSSSRNQTKRHRRTPTSTVDEILSPGNPLHHRPKRQRSHPDISRSIVGSLTSEGFTAQTACSMMPSQPQPFSQLQPYAQLPYAQLSHLLAASQAHPVLGSQFSCQAQPMAVPQVAQHAFQAQPAAVNVDAQHVFFDSNATSSSTSALPSVAVPSVGQGSYPSADYAPLPLQPIHDQAPTLQSMQAILDALHPHASAHPPPSSLRSSRTESIGKTSLQSQTPPTTDSDVDPAAKVARARDNATVDDAAFAREMGADEHFYALGNSDPIGEGNLDVFDG